MSTTLQREDSLRILMESVPDGFFVHDVNGRFLDVNARSCADLGYSRPELLKMTINDISCGSSPAENAEKWANAPPGLAITMSEIAIRKDGSTFPVELRITCQMIGGRKLFLGLARDISEREAARAAIEALNNALEQKVAERTNELREARERLQAVLDSAHDAIFFQDARGRFLVVNRATEEISGIPEADALGKTAIDIFGRKFGQPLRDEEERVIATGECSTVEELLPMRGENRLFVTTRNVHRDKRGEIVGLVGVSRDMTEFRLNEISIRTQYDRLKLAARVGRLGIWDYDLLNDMLECDEQWYRIMGRDPADVIRSAEEFRPFIHPDDADRVIDAKIPAARLIAKKQDYDISFRIVRPDGHIRFIRSAASILQDLDGTPRRAVGFVIDVTETWLAEERLKQTNLTLEEEKAMLARQGEELGRLAFEDALTGVANRRSLDQELERACSQAMRTGDPLALAMIDIDFFKLYNDCYGHPQGDMALKSVAQILVSAVHRPYDLVARYGGEEFVVLLPGTSQPEIVLEKITSELARLKLPHAGSPIAEHLTISCGCVVVSRIEDIDPTDLLAEGDKTLYHAKKSGRNRVIISRLC